MVSTCSCTRPCLTRPPLSTPSLLHPFPLAPLASRHHSQPLQSPMDLVSLPTLSVYAIVHSLMFWIRPFVQSGINLYLGFLFCQLVLPPIPPVPVARNFNSTSRAVSCATPRICESNPPHFYQRGPYKPPTKMAEGWEWQMGG